MSTAGASDSSMDSSAMDSRRSCRSCSSRMSSLLYDQHRLCVTCRGQEYEFHNKCVECLSWPDDIFEKYAKHRRSLLAKSKAKKLRSSLKASSIQPSSEASESQVQGNPSFSIDAIPPSGSVLEEKVSSLISESLAQFSSFTSSLEDYFARIYDLIASRFSEGIVRQDVINVSVPDSPTHVPIRPSLGTEQLDPSQPSSQQDYGKSGCESEESVHDASATFPELLAWVAGLRTVEFRIPQQVLDLARLDRVSQESPARAANPVLSGAQPAQVPFAVNARSLGVESSLSQAGAAASSWMDVELNL